MFFFILILLLIVSNGAAFSYEGSFNELYLDKKTTTTVNGIFVILVLFGHYSQYANFGGIFDESYLILKDHLRQMVVVTFLFYSGYGMMESIRIKGQNYIKGILSKVIRLVIRFDIAVFLFLILQTAFGVSFPIRKMAMSFLMWDAIGNSNWYIFDIVSMYLLMFLVFMPRELIKHRIVDNSGKTIIERHTIEIIFFFLLTILFIHVLKSVGKDTWWYNTLILLPIGTMYSEYRHVIERVVMKNDVIYFITSTIIGGIYIISFFHRDDSLFIYDVWAFAFMMAIILFTMKINIGNGLLDWFGKHVFSVYILQRLPMIAMDKLGFIEDHKYISLIVVILTTVVLALIFDKLTFKLEKILAYKSFTWGQAQ